LAGQHYATIGGRAQTTATINLRRWRRPIQGLILAYLFVITVLPTFALLLVSLSGFWNPVVHWSRLSFHDITKSLSADPETVSALQHSLVLALVGASIGMLAAACASVGAIRSQGRLRRIGDAAVKLPASISHIVIAVGFILAFSGSPFNLGG